MHACKSCVHYCYNSMCSLQLRLTKGLNGEEKYQSLVQNVTKVCIHRILDR